MASSLVDLKLPEGFAAGPVPLQIITKTHSSQEELVGNVRANIALHVPRFMHLPHLLSQRPEALAIVGGGPSVEANLACIKAFNQVMVCGSAHDHLVSLGVTPTFALAVDAKEDAVEYFQNPQRKTSFLIASQCHPNMFARLQGHKIAMWHFKGQLEDEEKHFNGEQTISWGCMVGVMSVQIALFLGFQHLHFFGFDCAYVGNKHHSYAVEAYDADIEAQKQVFTVNGKDFVSTTALVSQAEHMFDIFASEDGQYLKGYVHGDGLWANVIKASPPEMSEWLVAV